MKVKTNPSLFTQETELTPRMLESMDEPTMNVIKNKMLRFPKLTKIEGAVEVSNDVTNVTVNIDPEVISEKDEENDEIDTSMIKNLKGAPESIFCSSAKIVKLMKSKEPMPVVLVQGSEPPRDRTILWRNLCMIGGEFIECLVEMSNNKNKFYISAFDCMSEEYHVVSLFNRQAYKLLKVCDYNFEKIMKLLDFK